MEAGEQQIEELNDDLERISANAGEKERVKLLKTRWTARQKIATLRTACAMGASPTLKSALSDLQVCLKFSTDAYSPDAEAQIAQAKGWRTLQVPRANALVQQLTISKFLEAIEKSDTSAITALKDTGGAYAYSISMMLSRYSTGSAKRLFVLRWRAWRSMISRS